MKFSLLTTLAALAGVTFGPTAPFVLGQNESPTPLPTFTLDLRSYGWEPPWGRRHEINLPSLVVDREGRVVVGFTVQARSGLVTRSQPSVDFRILRFSPDGKVDSSLSLPTHEKAINSIYLSDTDQIIARANDSYQYLQADDGNLQKGVWKTLCVQPCGISQSPTRHTLVLHTKDRNPALTIIRFSPQPVLQRCGELPQFIESDHGRIEIYPRLITDEFAYFYWPSPEVPAYRWPLCDYDDRVELPVHGPYKVLNDKFLVKQAFTGRIGNTDRKPEVISLNGQIKFRPATLKYESCVGDDLKAIRSSARGDRIAVDMVTRRGGNLTLDISSHVTARRIAVYDIEAGRELVSIAVSPMPRHFEFDLSPDGRRLAILEDDKVRVIDIGVEEKAPVKPAH